MMNVNIKAGRRRVKPLRLNYDAVPNHSGYLSSTIFLTLVPEKPPPVPATASLQK